MNTAEFIQRLPKAELHLHIEGAIPWNMVIESANVPMADIPGWWAEDFRYDNFRHFGIAMSIGIRHVLTSVERYHLAARAIFQNLAEQNVRHVEISFGANVVWGKALPIADVVIAIKEALPEGLSGSVYGAFNREQVYPLDDEMVQETLNAPIDGIDLHGAEVLQSAKPYAEIFAEARRRQLLTKAHAGELQGAASVWEACQYLKVNRIEHGTRAVEDEKLMQYLVDEKITLDICPTSNWRLRVVEDLAAHPIKKLMQKGIAVTVNTDDPTYFGCTLTDELQLLVDKLGFSLPELAELEKNAFRAVHIDEGKRANVLAEIDALVNAV